MKYGREKHHEMFLGVTNIVKPKHPYVDSPYPIDKSQLHTTWKKSTSYSWAHCGPRKPKYKGFLITYAIDLKYFNSQSIERVLCIINHELTHITEGSHTKGSAHNPAFWNQVVENAKIIIDKKEQVEEIIGEFSTEMFIHEVWNEPNNSMTDGRIEKPDARRSKMKVELEGYGQ